MKYIMISVKELDMPERLVPIIFPDFLVHEMVYEAARPLMPKHSTVSARSAGDIDLESIATYGKSESLGVESHAGDDAVVLNYDYRHGIVA